MKKCKEGYALEKGYCVKAPSLYSVWFSAKHSDRIFQVVAPSEKMAEFKARNLLPQALQYLSVLRRVDKREVVKDWHDSAEAIFDWYEDVARGHSRRIDEVMSLHPDTTTYKEVSDFFKELDKKKRLKF